MGTRWMARCGTVPLALLLLALPQPALADALAGWLPSECPEGSFMRRGHEGAYCEPFRCERGCPQGFDCREVALCLRTIHVTGASSYRRIDDDLDIVVGVGCAAASDCAAFVDHAFAASHAQLTSQADARCEPVHVCARVSPPPASPPTRATAAEPASAPLRVSAAAERPRGCGGCSGSRGSAGLTAALPLMGGLVVLRRYRRARRSSQLRR